MQNNLIQFDKYLFTIFTLFLLWPTSKHLDVGHIYTALFINALDINKGLKKCT